MPRKIHCTVPYAFRPSSGMIPGDVIPAVFFTPDHEPQVLVGIRSLKGDIHLCAIQIRQYIDPISTLQNAFYREAFFTLFKPRFQIVFCFLVSPGKISAFPAELTLQVVPSCIVHGRRGLQQRIQRLDLAIHAVKCCRMSFQQSSQLTLYGGDRQKPLRDDMNIQMSGLIAVCALQVIAHASIKVPHRAQVQHILVSVPIPIKARSGRFAVQHKFVYEIILQERVHVDIPGQRIQRDVSFRRYRQILHKRIQRLVKALDGLLQQRRIVLSHRLLHHKVLACTLILDPDILGRIKRLVLFHKDALGIVQVQAAAADLRLFTYQVSSPIVTIDPEVHIFTVRHICHPQLFGQIKSDLVPHHAVIRCVGQQHPLFCLCHAKDAGLFVKLDLVALFLVIDPRGIPASFESRIRHLQIILPIGDVRQGDRRSFVLNVLVLMHLVQRSAVQRNIQAGQLRLHHGDGLRRSVRKAHHNTVAALLEGLAQHVCLLCHSPLLYGSDLSLQLHLHVGDSHLVCKEQIPLVLFRIMVAIDHISLLVRDRTGKAVVGIGREHTQHDRRYQKNHLCQFFSHACSPVHSFSLLTEKSSRTRVKFGL